MTPFGATPEERIANRVRALLNSIQSRFILQDVLHATRKDLETGLRNAMRFERNQAKLEMAALLQNTPREEWAKIIRGIAEEQSQIDYDA